MVETIASFNIADPNWTQPLTAEQNETITQAIQDTLNGLPQNYQVSLGAVMVGFRNLKLKQVAIEDAWQIMLVPLALATVSTECLPSQC